MVSSLHVSEVTGCRPARVDPADQHRKSALGRATHPRRTARFEIAQSSVAKYMAKRPGLPNQGWRTFLRNHAPDIAAMDLFVVPTLGFDLPYAFVIVRLDRRDLVWINVTANPTAEWVARRHCLGRGPSAPNSAILCPLLQKH
jgi:hypothetical protein